MVDIPVNDRNGLNVFQGFFRSNRDVVDQAKSHSAIKFSMVARRAHKGKTVFAFQGSLHSSNRCTGSVQGNIKGSAGNIGIRIQPAKRCSRGTPLLKPCEVTGIMDTLSILT
jgi:hypothetical protein